MPPWMLTLLFLAGPAFAADVGYYSWQGGGHDSIICAPSNKQHGTLGDCERPGPKNLTELYCDSKFAKGTGKEGKLGAGWQAACKKYEKSGRHEIVAARPVKYYAWQQGFADSIQCKEVPKGFGTPGKCIYPGPKNVKELICNDEFFKYSGERVDQDVYCHRHPWKAPVRTADDEEDSGDGGPAASADADGGGEVVMPNPAADRGDSGVSSEFP